MSQSLTDWKTYCFACYLRKQVLQEDISNYRPISCKFVAGKIFSLSKCYMGMMVCQKYFYTYIFKIHEFLINYCLLKHFLSNSLLSTSQFCFRFFSLVTTNVVHIDNLRRKSWL